MIKIEGQYTIKKKWFNNKGTFKMEQTPKKVVGTFVYGKLENKMDMGRILGDKYFEFCGSYQSKFGIQYYSLTGNIVDGKFEGNFETKRGVKKVLGTVSMEQVSDANPTAKAAPATK